MRIKETPWETRNLGVNSSVEYYVDAQDSLCDVTDIWSSKYEYQVLHIESGNSIVLTEAQKNGFKFIEMNIHLKKSL